MGPRILDLSSSSPRRVAGRIALIYAAFGILWILISDYVLLNHFNYIETFKGWMFIIATALLVYYLVREYATAVQRAARELQGSEERYRRIVETANEGICTVDPAGTLIWVNTRFAEMVGSATPTLSGEPLLNLVGDESKHTLAGRLRGDCNIPPHPCDVRLVGRDGQEVWTLAAISPMFDKAHCHVGSLLMFTDMSDRKRLESQVIQLQRMDAIGQLAGGIAHDFNNIVTAILGSVDLMRLQLKRQPIPLDDLASDIEQVERAGERAMALTRQLLTFGRRQLVRPEPVDLRRLLAEMEKMLSRLIREDIELRVVAGEDLPAVRADAGQLEQVIVNLVVNARDAMPGGGKLTLEASTVMLDAHYVSTHAEAREGPHVRIAVSDTGHGMDRRTLQRVFEPFFTTKPSGQGTGLGLPMVYGIVKQFGGHVTVYSEPNVGTTFKVYLPVADAAAAPAAEAKTSPVEAGGGETILVCEDSEAIRQLLCRILSEKGYQVRAFDSAPSVIDFSETHEGPIHLLITDVVMVGMNGRELAEALQVARPELKVLYVSGYTAEVVYHGILEPDQDFLPKPFTTDALLRRVREILNGTSVGS